VKNKEKKPFITKIIKTNMVKRINCKLIPSNIFIAFDNREKDKSKNKVEKLLK
tara:strand:+ start:1308 stop:1466 length:159 start_codon:yes stop_codon:yes gene_type:complete